VTKHTPNRVHWSALSRADMSLETIERMLGRFGEAVSIVRATMTWDFIPYGQASALFQLVLLLPTRLADRLVFPL
jgi:hypothetical protein